MVTDHERAWAELADFLTASDRPQHGTQFLLGEMQRIEARNRVHESTLPQSLRLYGVEVASGRARPDIRDVADPPPVDVSPSGDGGAMEPGHGHRPPQLTPGGHDGSTDADPAPVRAA